MSCRPCAQEVPDSNRNFPFGPLPTKFGDQHDIAFSSPIPANHAQIFGFPDVTISPADPEPDDQKNPENPNQNRDFQGDPATNSAFCPATG